MILTLFALLSIAMIFVVFFDLTYFIIPNAIPIFIFSIFLVYFVAVDYTRIPQNLILPTVIFVIGIPLSQCNILGFGDSKLLSSVSFGLGPFYTLHLIIFTILFGGLVALLIFVFNKYIHTIRLQAFQNSKLNKFSAFFIPDLSNMKTEAASSEMKKYMPYGLAIAPAGLYTAYLSLGFVR